MRFSFFEVICEYSLINRMSEDIDLAFSFPVLGCDPVELSIHGSRTARLKHALRIDDTAKGFVKDYLLPNFKALLSKLDDGIDVRLISEAPLDVGIFYSRSLNKNEYGGAVEARVLLETGGRSDNQPTDEVAVQHMLGSAVTEMKDESFQVLPLSPQRTLLEKIFGIHTNNDKGEVKLRHARHLYDVVMIHDSNPDWCLDKALFGKVVTFCDYYYKWHLRSCESAIQGPIVLCPTKDELLEAYKVDWESMADMFPRGELPYSFDELLEKLSLLESSINNHYF